MNGKLGETFYKKGTSHKGDNQNEILDTTEKHEYIKNACILNAERPLLPSSVQRLWQIALLLLKVLCLNEGEQTLRINNYV